MNKNYKDGIAEGRRQIVRNLKKHYDETHAEQPHNYAGCDIGVSIPETTLYKYFKELAHKS